MYEFHTPVLGASTNDALLKPLHIGLDLHKSSILIVEGNKTVVSYNSSFLLGHSFIFSLPMMSKLGVNGKTGITSEFKLPNEYFIFEIGEASFSRNYGIQVCIY